MREKLRHHIDCLFEEAPVTKRAVELKEEILQNLIDRYEDLLAEGKSEEAAYNIVIAGIGDISGLIEDLKRQAEDPYHWGYPIEKIERSRQRSALLVSIAVALYILSVIPALLIGEAGIILMLVIIAVATGLLVYNNMTRLRPTSEDSVVDEFKAWSYETSGRRELRKAISGALWMIILVIYFLLSFTTGAWYITWVLFLVAGAIESILKAVFDLKR